MDKPTSGELKHDYASVLSGTSQTPKVEMGIESLLAVDDDKIRVLNILCSRPE